MTNLVDPLRHRSVFSPDKFGCRQIDVIGAGATGSRIAMELAKLGVQNLHVWDFDEVEEHNIANQVFGVGDIGKSKVEALAERIENDTGLKIEAHNEEVTGRHILGSIVFLLTDTMSSRKAIWEGALRYKPAVNAVIETRMGRDEGRVYTLSPTSPPEIELWESTLCEDEEASDSLCGARVTVGPTAVLVTAYAIWAFIRWFEWESGEGAKPECEHIFYANPPTNMTREASLV